MGNGSSERIHSMDALRASTMLLLVPVHAAGLLAINGQPGAWATSIFWVVHVFRLPLFFAMSGFFLTLLLSRRGFSSTARNRSLRIVVPLAVGLVTLVPLLIATGQATGTAISDGDAGSGSFDIQPSFLWFLWYLLILDGIAFTAYLLAPRMLSRLGDGMHRTIANPLIGIALLAVPTACLLWFQPRWFVAPATDTFVPSPSALAYYALFFALGATLCVHRGLVETAKRDAWKWLACAVVATVPAGLLFTFQNSAELSSRTEVHGAALLIYAVATWTSLMALIGLASRYLSKPRPAFRYMADSSYWIYLSHLAPMVLLVALVAGSNLPTPFQFAFVTVGSLAASLATYPLLVRYTAIGRVLNGPRQRKKSVEKSEAKPRPALARPL